MRKVRTKMIKPENRTRRYAEYSEKLEKTKAMKTFSPEHVQSSEQLALQVQLRVRRPVGVLLQKHLFEGNLKLSSTTPSSRCGIKEPNIIPIKTKYRYLESLPDILVRQNVEAAELHVQLVQQADDRLGETCENFIFPAHGFDTISRNPRKLFDINKTAN